MGLMGSGKSYFAQLIAHKTLLNFIDIDEEIEKKTNCSINQIFEQYGEKHFRDLETEILLNIIKNNNKKTIVACGGGLPCFNDNIITLNSNGITIWLDEKIEVCTNRLIHLSKNKPYLKDKSNNEIYKILENMLFKRFKFYSQSMFVLKDKEINEKNIIKIIEQYE